MSALPHDIAHIRDVRDVDAVAILDLLPDRVVRYRRSDLTILYSNSAWAESHFVGPADSIGRRLGDFLGEDELSGLRAQLERLSPNAPVLIDEVPRPAPHSPGRWIEWMDRLIPANHACDEEILAVGRDVTERHRAETELAASEARFRELADQSADVVWRFVWKPIPRFDYMSPSVERILGYAPSYFLEDFSRFLDILDDEGRALIARALRGDPMPPRYDLNYRAADGSIVIGEAQNTVIAGGMQGVSRDVTELRTLQAELADLALRDPLTGLANRRLLDELLDAGLARTARTGLPLVVVYIDLDEFKTVNDTYGHEIGDAVLRETASRLRSIVRSEDLVARIGGDEFVVVHEPSAECGDLDITERIERTMARPFRLDDGRELSLQASMGRADTHLVEHDGRALLAAADRAMYASKRLRRDAAGTPTVADV